VEKLQKIIRAIKGVSIEWYIIWIV